jgi:tetratricopeptide (TPR) repeat protein
VCEAEQWEDALVELKRQSYAQSVSQYASAWRAKIYIGMERYQDVLELEGEARRTNCPIEPYLAVAHARSGNVKKALSIAEEALRLKRPGAAMALGHVYFADKQYELALKWYEAAARNRMQRASVLRAVGRALIALRDYREARIAYELAIRLTPFVQPEDLLQLAKCLHRTHPAYAAEIELLAHEKA